MNRSATKTAADFLELDAEDRLVCPECGNSYIMLSGHLWQIHEISADEFRAARGIPGYVGLTNPDLHKRKVAEGRSSVRRNPEEWAEVKARGSQPAAREKAGQSLSQRYKEGRYGSLAPPEFFDGSNHAALAELRKDPEFVEAWREKLRGHRGGWVENQCEICGKTYGHYRSNSTSRSCGAPECTQASRVSLGRGLGAAYKKKIETDPVFREQARERFDRMRKDPAVRAKINATLARNSERRLAKLIALGPHDERNYRYGCRCDVCRADHARTYREYRLTGVFPNIRPSRVAAT
jgi:hypothetical protein